MNSTSTTLMERLRNRSDGAAWNRFFRLYAPMLDQWARAAGLSEQDAADLVQDVLLVVVKKFSTFEYDRNKSFRAWLKSIAVNKWRDRMRDPNNRLGQPFSGELEKVAAIESTFDDRESRRHVLAQALALISDEFQPRTWQAFVLHGLQGRSAAEAGAQLGMSEGAVYVAKYRVLKRLREEFSKLLE